MSTVRPILDSFQTTPWVRSMRVDDSAISRIVPNQVQIAITGDGPMSSRSLVPLTRAAHDLLYGEHRDGAERALRGALALVDGTEGVNNLRGISLADGLAGFGVNLYMSNIEAGFYPDNVAAGNRRGFVEHFARLAPSVMHAKAQNTGWLDLGPDKSERLLELVEHGERAPRANVEEAALTLAHELQHSITPPNAVDGDPRLVWLEEGIAETFAWWPGTVAQMMTDMGYPTDPGQGPDPFTVRPETTASTEYRGRHRSVMRLLGLAGINPTLSDGTPDAAALRAASSLLQGRPLEQVPRTLSRAIAREHDLAPDDETALRDLLLDIDGRPDRVDAIEALVTPTAPAAPEPANAAADPR